jgi:hypothetical protein
MFRPTTSSLARPFIAVTKVVQMIDTPEAFAATYVITFRGSATPSETPSSLL